MQQYHAPAQGQGQSQGQSQGQTRGQVQAHYSPRQLLESARRAEADGNVDLAAHVARYVLEHFAGSPESAEAYSCLLRLGQPPIEQSVAPVSPQPKQIAHSAYASPAPQPTATAARFNPAPAVGPPAPAWAPLPQPVQTAMPAAAFAPMPAQQPAAGFASGHATYAPAQPARAPAPMPHASVNGGGYGAPMQTPVQAIAANFAPAAPYRGADPNANPPAMIHHAPEVTPQYRGGRIVARLAFAAGGLMITAGVVSPILALTGLIGAAPSLLGAGLVACALIATGLLALLGGQTALAVFDQADNMRELVELERTRWNG